jgi:peptidoglycan DL-endopeptidase CwlO
MSVIRPRRRLRALAGWSLGIGLTWLLLGQQVNGQPVVQFDLTALPAVLFVDRNQVTRSSSQQQPARPNRQHSPRSSAAPPKLTLPPTSQAAPRAVAFALGQRGKPYVWGAEGPDAYDCSGLTWLAWQHAGLAWTRMTAAGQWQWLHDRGGDVPAAQLRAGDLLFYANNPHDPASIHHVAIHIGNGRMVEAPEPGIPVRVVPIRWDGFYGAARPGK